ncbi:MAG: PHP domain-containing protein [Methanomicrobiales archaeon]|nr:PHP domain-containing protein [Methanomicrobiales archaeon]
MIADLHIHSKYSYDCMLPPERILKVAAKRGLEAIAVTDHGTIRGGLETQRLNRNRDLQVIAGCEIHTDIGDVIGLCLNGEIESRNSLEVIREIRSQGGFAILPHPCRSHSFSEGMIRHFDAIEVFNSRSTADQNARALLLAKEHSKPFVAGSDAHFASEIGLVRVVIPAFQPGNLPCVTDERLISGALSPLYMRDISRMIRLLRKILERHRR